MGYMSMLHLTCDSSLVLNQNLYVISNKPEITHFKINDKFILNNVLMCKNTDINIMSLVKISVKNWKKECGVMTTLKKCLLENNRNNFSHQKFYV